MDKFRLNRFEGALRGLVLPLRLLKNTAGQPQMLRIMLTMTNPIMKSLTANLSKLQLGDSQSRF